MGSNDVENGEGCAEETPCWGGYALTRCAWVTGPLRLSGVGKELICAEGGAFGLKGADVGEEEDVVSGPCSTLVPSPFSSITP